MKYWLSHLPLEVWVNVFRHPWIERQQLGRIVDRFGNRKFAEYLQFYLHDWGRRTLKELDFVKKYNCRRIHKHRAACVLPMAVPQTPMPANIKSFGLIYIDHFDQQTIDFLHQIQPLLTDINLDFHNIEPYNYANLRTILANLEPLIADIHSLCFNVRALPTVGQLFGGKKLDKVKMLTICHGGWDKVPNEEQQATTKFIMDWLTTDGNGSRLCDVILPYINSGGFSEQIFAAIRQDFLAAKEPRTFAITVYPIYKESEFHLENGIGEELHSVWQIGYDQNMQITRHRANCNMELQEWIIENKAKRSNHYNRNIYVQTPTIGPIDALGEQQDQRPSTSRKA